MLIICVFIYFFLSLPTSYSLLPDMLVPISCILRMIFVAPCSVIRMVFPAATRSASWGLPLPITDDACSPL